MYMVGHWPMPQTDHINGDRTDNRWENLRQVSAQENCKNVAMSTRNKTGCVGIYRYRRKQGQYCASIHIAGRGLWLGTFPPGRRRLERASVPSEHLDFHHGMGDLVLFHEAQLRRLDGQILSPWRSLGRRWLIFRARFALLFLRAPRVYPHLEKAI
jgi:hypothetical protein